MLKTIYNIDGSSVELYAIDANDALSRHPNEWSEKPWTDEMRAKAEAEKAKADEAQKRQDNVPPKKYEARHRGRGSYSVLDADGNEVLEGLTKEDAELFNTSSEESQEAYIEAEKKTRAGS